MHISRRLIALGAASAILVTACGGSAATTAPSTAATTAPASDAPATAGSTDAPASAAVDYKACVAFDTGGLGDKGFNDLAQKGLDDAAALGFQTASSEAQGATDYAHNIQTLIDEGCQTIVTVGFNQAQATIDATLANPDIAFAQVDATWNEAGADFEMGTADDMPFPPNFTGLDFQIDEAGTLAGYLAAGFSQSKIIGTYGGQQFPGVTRFMDGMYAGIRIYNERKSADVKLLGWDPTADGGKGAGTFVGGDNPWGDAAKGEQLARTFMDQGADIVHPVAGSTGNGSIKAMLGAGKWAIGVDTDQAISLAEYSKAILTSSEKVIDVAVLDAIKMNAGGDMGGENYIGTLANGGVRLSPFHDLDSQVSAELKAEVDQLSKDIASGAVKIADYLK